MNATKQHHLIKRNAKTGAWFVAFGDRDLDVVTRERIEVFEYYGLRPSSELRVVTTCACDDAGHMLAINAECRALSPRVEA